MCVLIKIRYYVTIYVVVFVSPLLGFFPFSSFPSDPCFLRQFSWFLRQFSCFLCQILSLLNYPCGTNCVVRIWGLVWGGGSWMAWVRSWPNPRRSSCVRFNLPTPFPVPNPSPAPCPEGDWGVELRR